MSFLSGFFDQEDAKLPTFCDTLCAHIDYINVTNCITPLQAHYNLQGVQITKNALYKPTILCDFTCVYCCTECLQASETLSQAIDQQEGG